MVVKRGKDAWPCRLLIALTLCIIPLALQNAPAKKTQVNRPYSYVSVRSRCCGRSSADKKPRLPSFGSSPLLFPTPPQFSDALSSLCVTFSALSLCPSCTGHPLIPSLVSIWVPPTLASPLWRVPLPVSLRTWRETVPPLPSLVCSRMAPVLSVCPLSVKYVVPATLSSTSESGGSALCRSGAQASSVLTSRILRPQSPFSTSTLP